ncbi:DNA cytosine methyltransferase [Pontibacillus yanchengensis]|uniref:DNA cytosine methyltransferase n=1 Tax=Pontibacillus yanchengensis TaxID=462910 RepID=UPI0012699900
MQKGYKIKEDKYNVVDLFDGAGGLCNGFEQTNRFNVVAAVEIDKGFTVYLYPKPF